MVSSSRKCHGPGVVARNDERLVDELADDVEHRERVDVVAGGDGLGGVEVEVTGEHREPREHRSLGVVELVVGPVDRRPQRLVAAHRASGRSGEEPEALVEPLRDLRRGEHAGARRGELDRERDSVETPAYLEHGAHVVVADGEVVLRRRRSIGEEPHRIARQRRVERGIRGRDGERPDRDDLLARQAEALPAGREHAEPGAPAQQVVDEVRNRAEHVLAVVEHQQRLAAREAAHQRLTRGQSGSRRRLASRPGHHGRDRLHHRVRLGDRSQLAEPHAV